MKIKIASVDSVIIYFGEFISKDISNKVKSVYSYLKSLENDSFIEIIPSYTSILIKYDILKYDISSITIFLKNELKNIKNEDFSSNKLIVVDTFYSTEVGFDLQRVALNANISIEEVIKIHSSKIYDVFTIGFLPGFAYLASVDDKIITPRLNSPRKKIPKGSVAIADSQTAVYPCDSPGGWNIIGRTTFEFFDKSLENLSPVCINTQIKFNPISKEEYTAQGGKIEF
ncbi:5-oxoprolinase subunit B family protein [Arcobacter arenosus]|uniref:5-oxoprolinase subunit B family protein n=1 Tax=Arcobacter arenosus TaxID=2576037 RepID=UPI003BAC9BCE